MVFCKSMLFLLATSKDSSSSVIWTCSFFFTRCTSVFNFVSASTTRAFSCSISILVCLLIYFISCEYTITPYNRFIGFQTGLLFPGDNSKNFGSMPFCHCYHVCERIAPFGEHRRLTRLEISDILPVTYLVAQWVLDYWGCFETRVLVGDSLCFCLFRCSVSLDVTMQ